MAIDVDQVISQCYEKQLIPAPVIKELCEKAKELLVQESNVRSIKSPCTVVGDVHGQFFDLLEIFRIGGYAPNTNYVFLGDYVDRGHHSVEVITLLICLKLRYPSRITLVRGNHESRAVTTTYGFYTECMRKYGDSSVWNYFTELFDYLVLAVVIDDTILAIHDQIRVIDRFKEIPHEGPMADLVWSDPVPAELLESNGHFAVSPRGAGYVFGKDVTRKAGNLASILEISPSLERYFNVFGPCPIQDREPNKPLQHDRLKDFLEEDSLLKKINQLKTVGQGSGHSLYDEVPVDTNATIDRYFT
ncbi:putative serine/threonine protein phosphatase [Boothiomyces sp. JEL0838]|nr:putative serine/threonine protein phosphatase [Boothiomyces sp. JEL0838]